MTENLVQSLSEFAALPLVLPDLPLQLMPICFPLLQPLLGLFLLPFNLLVALEQLADLRLQLFKITEVHSACKEKNFNF